MRNSEVQKVQSFVAEVKEFYPEAKAFLAARIGESKRGNRYPRVFYAELKNKKWGVTFPGVFDIKHSAINCPDVENNELFATAMAMKIESMLILGDYIYLEWARSYGYLRSGKDNWDTGVEYIRTNQQDDYKGKYLLYIPVTGKGYVFIRDYNSIKKAIWDRDQFLYRILQSSEDFAGPVPERRLNKYKRVLCSGYFKSIYLDKTSDNKYEVNREKIAKVFANVAAICEDTLLKGVFSYYQKVFERNVTLDELDLMDSYQKYLTQYFKAINLYDDIFHDVIAIARNERKYFNGAVSKLRRKFA